MQLLHVEDGLGSGRVRCVSTHVGPEGVLGELAGCGVGVDDCGHALVHAVCRGMHLGAGEAGEPVLLARQRVEQRQQGLLHQVRTPGRQGLGEWALTGQQHEQGLSRVAQPGGAPDAVHIVLHQARRVQLQRGAHGGQVQATGGHVGADQDASLAGLEVPERGHPLRLGQRAVQLAHAAGQQAVPVPGLQVGQHVGVELDRLAGGHKHHQPLHSPQQVRAQGCHQGH